MLDCMEILAIAAKREIRVYAIKSNWHLDETIQSKIMVMVFSMAAGIERGLIFARTKEALIDNFGFTFTPVNLRADEGSPSRETGVRPAFRTAERLRQKQAGPAPSGNRGAARQRVHPEVQREALQFFACQARKLDEEARHQEIEAVESGRFGTFEPLGPRLVKPILLRMEQASKLGR